MLFETEHLVIPGKAVTADFGPERSMVGRVPTAPATASNAPTTTGISQRGSSSLSLPSGLATSSLLIDPRTY